MKPDDTESYQAVLDAFKIPHGHVVLFIRGLIQQRDEYRARAEKSELEVTLFKAQAERAIAQLWKRMRKLEEKNGRAT